MQDYLINNFAAPTNLSGIIAYLKHSEGISIKRETLSSYVRLLESAKILYKCPRFDLKSRKSLRGGEKYYLADPGIRFARNTDTRVSYGPSLENALYTHLRSKGYDVSVGTIGKLECDFIVRKRNQYAYIQVSMSVQDRRSRNANIARSANWRTGIRNTCSHWIRYHCSATAYVTSISWNFCKTTAISTSIKH